MLRIEAPLFVLALLSAPTAFADWQPERLPWGDPDLQGTWTNATVTLLERPDELPNLVLTEQEARQVETGVEEFKEAVDELPEGDLPAGEDVGGYNSFWIDPGNRVARVNGEPRGSLITSPDDGQIPYSLWGRARFYWALFQSQRRNNPETQLLGERCMVGFGSSGGPPMLPVLYNNYYQIVQSPGHVMILVEMNHNARIIRIGGQPLPPEIRPWLGDSIGHWEGNTLVVRTTQFHPQQNLRAAIRHQLYLTQDSVVTERFTRLGEKEILYRFTVEDDDIYREPWMGEVPMIGTDQKIYEYACHEGNYSLPGILAGAREEDLALAVVALLAASWRVWAHHAFSAEFDADAPVTLRGKVTRIEWINPHAWIHLAAEQEDGSTVAWMVEGGTPNTLLRAGIHRNSLPIGSEIVVRGYQSKDAACSPACKANGRDLAFPDGRRVFMGSSGTGAPRDGYDPRER
jgi:hypothetical protein